MADAELRDDILTFAPRPRTIVFEINGERVETELWNFIDLPGKKSLRVYELEDGLNQPDVKYADTVDGLTEIVGLLCPKLLPDQVAALAVSQMRDAISASHGIVPRAEAAADPPTGEPDASSPSAGAASPAGSPETPTASDPMP